MEGRPIFTTNVTSDKNIHSFEQFLLVRRGLQPITIQGYCRAAKKFIETVGTHFPMHSQVEDYVAEFYRGGYSYSHVTNTSLALERWMEFIESPIKLGRQKKPRTLIKDTLTEAEVTKLIFNCENIREKAIVTLLAYSGLRNKELCNLKVRDIDFGNNTVRVNSGKGVKDGIVCISGEATKTLMQYLVEFQRTLDDYLFTTLQYNNKYDGGALRKLVKTLSERAAMTKRVFPQLLRHTLAVNMLMRGAGIFTIKEQLRHVFVDTTLIYLNSVLYNTRSEYDKYVPSYV